LRSSDGTTDPLHPNQHLLLFLDHNHRNVLLEQLSRTHQCNDVCPPSLHFCSRHVYSSRQLSRYPVPCSLTSGRTIAITRPHVPWACPPISCPSSSRAPR